MKDLKDKVIVITGASSGIGRTTARLAARQHATVVLVSRQGSALRDVAEECERLGGRPIAAPADVNDSEALRKIAKSAYRQFGHIDVWVNNAAVTLFAKFESAPVEDYRRVIETNLYGYFNGAKAVLPFFHEQGKGTLINVSSVVGRLGSPYVSAYTTSKFAINGWSESLRMELLDEPGIDVCTILPASIDTPLFQHAANYTGRAIKPLPPVYSSQKVADAIIECIHTPRAEIFVGPSGRILSGLRTLAPRLTERMVAQQVEQEHFQKGSAEPTDGNLFSPMSLLNTESGGWRKREPSGDGGKGPLALTAVAIAGIATLGYLMTRNTEPVKNTRRQIADTTRHASERLRHEGEKLMNSVKGPAGGDEGGGTSPDARVEVNLDEDEMR